MSAERGISAIGEVFKLAVSPVQIFSPDVKYGFFAKSIFCHVLLSIENSMVVTFSGSQPLILAAGVTPNTKAAVAAVGFDLGARAIERGREPAVPRRMLTGPTGVALEYAWAKTRP